MSRTWPYIYNKIYIWVLFTWNMENSWTNVLEFGFFFWREKALVGSWTKWWNFHLNDGKSKEIHRKSMKISGNPKKSLKSKEIRGNADQKIIEMREKSMIICWKFVENPRKFVENPWISVQNPMKFVKIRGKSKEVRRKFVKKPWISREIYWNSQKIHGNLWKFAEKPRKSVQNPWKSVKNAWKSVKIHGNPWEIHENLPKIHEYPWKIQWNPWKFIKIQGS